MVPKQSTNFISKFKEVEVKDKLDFLFVKLKKRYGWSNREFNQNKENLLHLYKDTDKLREDMIFVGCSTAEFDKVDIKITKGRLPTNQKSVGLDCFR